MGGKIAQFPDKTGDGKMPSTDQLKAFEERYQNIKGDADELRGDMSALLKEGETDSNIHKKAFKLVQQCKRMDDVKRSAFLAHFDHYRGNFNLDAQLDLPLDDVASQAAE